MERYSLHFNILVCFLMVSVVPVSDFEIDQSNSYNGCNSIDLRTINSEVSLNALDNEEIISFQSNSATHNDYNVAKSMNPSSNTTSSLKDDFVALMKKKMKLFIGLALITLSLFVGVYGYYKQVKLEQEYQRNPDRVRSFYLAEDEKEAFDKALPQEEQYKKDLEIWEKIPSEEVDIQLIRAQDQLQFENRIGLSRVAELPDSEDASIPNIYRYDMNYMSGKEKLEYITHGPEEPLQDYLQKFSESGRDVIHDINRRYRAYTWLKTIYTPLTIRYRVMQVGSVIGMFFGSGLTVYSMFFED